MISRARRGTAPRDRTRARAWVVRKRRPGGWRGEEGGQRGTGDERRNARPRKNFYGGEPRSRWARRRRVKQDSERALVFRFRVSAARRGGFGRAFEGARRTDSSLPPRTAPGTFLHLSCGGPGARGRERGGARRRPEIRRFARSGKRPPGPPRENADARGERSRTFRSTFEPMQDLGERRVLLNQPPLPRAVFLHALQGVLLLRGPLRGRSGAGRETRQRRENPTRSRATSWIRAGVGRRGGTRPRGADRATLAGDAPSSWGAHDAAAGRRSGVCGEDPPRAPRRVHSDRRRPRPSELGIRRDSSSATMRPPRARLPSVLSWGPAGEFDR